MQIKFSLLLILCFFSCQLSAQNLTKEERQVFDDVVYVISPTTGNRTVVKWANPIKYLVKGEASPFLMAHVDLLFSQIQQLTNLSITKATDTAGANFVITVDKVDPSKNIRTTTGQMVYTGSIDFTLNEKSEIISAGGIFVEGAYPSKAEIKYSLIRSLLRGIGFAKKSSEAPYSLFHARRNNNIKFDKFDSHIISTFYNDNIKPGMIKSQVDQFLNYN